MGVLSALGPTRREFWQALGEGRDGIRKLVGPRLEGLRVPTGAQLLDYQPGDHFEQRQVDNLDPFAQYFVIAGREAVQDAGFIIERPERVAIVSGSAGGGQPTLDEQYHRLYGQDRKVHPFTIPKFMLNAGASSLAQELGVTGPSFAVSTACSSSNHALGQAFWMVRQGLVDAALAGGSEAPFCNGYLRAWDSIRAMDPVRCRPFSRNRQGMTLGEGGGVLLLEAESRALGRGARIYAEIVGFGMSSDAHDLTRPLPEGAAAAMRAALQDASMAPDEVDYINAHGTGTPANDGNETRAIRAVFGSHADRLLVSSTKSAHGHALGAAGALEAAASLFALQEGIVPATLGYQEPDPECDLDYVHQGPRKADLRVAMSNTFAFGGLNAVLVFRRNS
ncbi:MAG: 3-oxoacyl-[acyl-carrier-protein] synthase 2 [Candidatus Xenobia bacterium]